MMFNDAGFSALSLGSAWPAAAIAWLIDHIPPETVPTSIPTDPDCWQLSPQELEQHDIILAASLHDPQSLLEALRLLDDWHRPVGPQAHQLRSPDAVHQWLRDLALRISADGQINPPDGAYSVIPAGAPGSMPRNISASTYPGAALINWLNNVTLVPTRVGRCRLSDASLRTPGWRGELPSDLRFSYRRRTSHAQPLPLEDIIIGVAPLLVDKGSATLVPCSHGTNRCYAVQHHYPPETVNDILRQASEQQVDMLLFPEMALNETSLKCVRAWLRRNPGHGMKLVSAGVLRPSDIPGEKGVDRNEVVHLDTGGEEILVQHKLSPWDINREQAMKLGVAEELGIGEKDLALENIRFGGEIHLVDVPALGRLMALICADIDDDEPMDRLIGAARVDWLHAPIMDHSTCWQIEEKTPGADLARRWSIHRARRAASAGCRFIVTNSAVLTSMANVINRATESGKKYVLDEIGVCYLCDGHDGAIRHLNVRRREHGAPLLDIIRWPAMLQEDWPG